jgi:hypothetical protein
VPVLVRTVVKGSRRAQRTRKKTKRVRRNLPVTFR